MNDRGFVFKNGKVREIPGIHSAELGPVSDAVRRGAVRIRLWGDRLAIQARSRYLAKRAERAVCEAFDLSPKVVEIEAAGKFERIDLTTDPAEAY